MALYTVSMKQLIINSLLISLVSSAVVVLFMISKEYFLDLPDVYKNLDNKCIKVVNFKNGDAYNCNDVDVILRKYHLYKENSTTEK